MDEEQKKKFRMWLDTTGRVYRDDCRDAWEACLEANKVEEEEPEPSPTEMVKRLLEKGWTIEQGDDTQLTEWYRLRDPEKPHFTHTFSVKQVTEAYRKAFPPKKKVEVEVWYDPSGEHGELRQIPEGGISDDKALSFGWTKGIATFWIEEEQ